MTRNAYTKKIGSVIKHENDRVKVKKQDSCEGCYFSDKVVCPTQSINLRKAFGDCCSDLRSDKRSIIFVDVRTAEEKKRIHSTPKLNQRPSEKKKLHFFY